MDVMSKVIMFAVEHHAGQKDKFFGDPHILHSLRIMMDCPSSVEKMVAILHDVVEDTDATFDDIRALFNTNRLITVRGVFYVEDIVVDAVDALTQREGESYEDYLARVKANSIALSVKLKEIQDNLSHIPMHFENKTQLTAKYLKAIAILQ